jgi:hypothetical protein
MSGTPAKPFLQRLDGIDRRWIFLLMALSVAGPILWVGVTGKTFPETPTPAVRGAFDAIDRLPEGARVLISFDFDPASAGELQPMATALLISFPTDAADETKSAIVVGESSVSGLYPGQNVLLFVHRLISARLVCVAADSAYPGLIALQFL